ncbi:HD-GYP domain-containing protein [Siculibacillus lacustris]|nr:HD domain-containing phosphohydrolase [Siculibacillus lacustris]
MPTTKTRVLLVHEPDTVPVDLARALGRDFAVTTRAWTSATTADLAAGMAVIVDVDLDGADRVARLKGLLAAKPDGPRLFAVDRNRRRARIQAGVLGATACVMRPPSIDELRGHLAAVWRRASITEDLGRGESPAEGPGARSILAADTALGDLFEACLGRGTVDQDQVRAASSQVTGAIQEIGLEPWLEAVRSHHGGTYQHCLLVTGIAVGFGTALGLGRLDLERLAMAGLTHDVGKAKIPVALLDKPGRLAEREFGLVKKHPEYGWDFLRRSDPTMDPAILDAVLHHHEYLDGSGYPHGLTGREIPDLTRIMTICDIYGALAERRAYKAPMQAPEILKILQSMAEAGKLERALVDAFATLSAGEAVARRPLRRRA